MSYLRRAAVAATRSATASLSARSATATALPLTRSIQPCSISAVPSLCRWMSSVPAMEKEREQMIKANPDIDVPQPDGSEKPSEKVTKIVDEIMKLNIFESIQLSKALQKSMGLEGISLGAMGGGGGGGAPAAAAPAAAAKPAEEKKAEVQTSFTVRLDSFEAKDKIKVIKEVRAITGLGLKESKELVEGAPKELKKDMNKADAEALVKKLKEAGAKCSLV